uniref:Uncharacterized protein n=1 Tax=Arundo donax TaxID=35708 RepID=A0A0A8XSC3_ARUDO
MGLGPYSHQTWEPHTIAEPLTSVHHHCLAFY